LKKQVIFHEDYFSEYTFDPAAQSGRMEAIMEELTDFEIVRPKYAKEEDILLVHTDNHFLRIKNSEEELFSVALLSAGGAILAAELAMENQPIFANIRPPGHHASPNGYWGFCFFNNVAISIRSTAIKYKIPHSLIIDFDLHFGDGTDNTFRNDSSVSYYSCEGSSPERFIRNLENFLAKMENVGLVGVSAGFDRHIDDWGGLLSTEDYGRIGRILKTFCEDNGSIPRFACLEGGYNHNVLGKNVRKFINSFY
jgi:acetoin utilization deacetylase AcuC-like enzyme